MPYTVGPLYRRESRNLCSLYPQCSTVPLRPYFFILYCTHIVYQFDILIYFQFLYRKFCSYLSRLFFQLLFSHRHRLFGNNFPPVVSCLYSTSNQSMTHSLIKNLKSSFVQKLSLASIMGGTRAILKTCLSIKLELQAVVPSI